jgi:YD repeat-containing protein
MSYDGLDRLIGTNAPNLWGQASYSYDVLDNLRTSQISGRSNTHNYDLSGSNRLLSINNNGNLINYGYDNQGNITQRGNQAFRFDLANRITSALGKASYRYDGLGHRSKINFADGSTRLQIYSPAGQLLFANQSASSTGPARRTWYIYLRQNLIAEVNQ